MANFTVGWYPFAAHGYSQTETGQMINEGLGMLGQVANIRFYWSTNPTIVIGSQANVPWVAAAYQRWIWFNRSKPQNVAKVPREFLVMAMAHEWMHTWGYANSLGAGHSNDKDSIMYPNGSQYRWFSPGDCRLLVSRYGMPANRPKSYPPVSIEVEKMRDADANWQEFNKRWIHYRDQRNAETDKEKRAELNQKTRSNLAQRDAFGAKRQSASDKASELIQGYQRLYGVANPVLAALSVSGSPESCELFDDQSQMFGHVTNAPQMIREQVCSLQKVQPLPGLEAERGKVDG